MRTLLNATIEFMHRAVLALSLLAPVTAQRAPFGAFRPIANLPVVEGLAEISGIVASRANPGCFWVHGDKGDRALLLAIDLKGRIVQRFHVKGAKSKDWEDIAYGPGPVTARGYLYIGDFGNNDLKRKKLALLRLPEPTIGRPDGVVRPLTGVSRIKFRYPDNRKHDAETLLVDPIDGSAYILTKEVGFSACLYRYPLPLEERGTKTLELVKQFTHLKPKFSAGDVSADGRWVVVRNRKNVFFYSRREGKPFATAFDSPARLLSGNRQGNAEALAFDLDASSLVAISETSKPIIWQSRALLCLQPARVWVRGVGGFGLGLGGVPKLSGPATEIGLWGAWPFDVVWLTLDARGQLPGREVPFVRLPIGSMGMARAVLGGLPFDRSLHGAQWSLRAVGLHGESRGLAIRSVR